MRANRRRSARLLALALVAFGCAGERPIVFAIVGDNRGGEDGLQPAVFEAIADSIDAARPELVLHTGDMIYGYTEDRDSLEAMWSRYEGVVERIDAPVHHAPGNHDLHDALTARAWRARWGEPYVAFDRRGARFVILDTESDPGRLGDAQFRWLEGQLATAPGAVVVVLHRPVFPVARNIGASLDVDPAERDRLHRLFVRHRDRVAAVFQGHDHLYQVEERDGVRYHIVAGGGAELYAPWEMGGYHHWVLARLAPGRPLEVEVRVVAAPAANPGARAARAPAAGPPAPPLPPGSRLDSWESSLWFFGWDVSTRSMAVDQATEGERGLALSFDLARFSSPLLAAEGALGLADADSVSIALWAPRELGGRLTVVPVIVGRERHDGHPIRLQSGWNRIAAALEGWVPPANRGEATGIEWLIGGDDPALAGAVVFDDLRIGGRAVEGWEVGLAWGVWNAEARAAAGPARHGARAVEVVTDAPPAVRAALYAPFEPAADLSEVPALAVEVWLPPDAARRPRIGLALRAGDRELAATGFHALEPGWNTVAVGLDPVPSAARRAVQVVRWIIDPGEGTGEVRLLFDDFRAAKRGEASAGESGGTR